jgi:ATP-dependent RNA helicase SUPV3L1/SUV3
MAPNNRIVAVLGPTNTGKTHYAIERMLGHRTGIMGLPLRLLAREVYDKIVALRGPSCCGFGDRRGAHCAAAREILGLYR